uniref:Uncharacterized protein n=1 Tax=Entomoneis paludosa TaxID=265537 RepID=A0A7S2YKU5_9STRA
MSFRSFKFLGFEDPSNENDERPNTTNRTSDSTMDHILARSTLRTWIPTWTVLSFWCSLLPLLTWWKIISSFSSPSAASAAASLARVCSSEDGALTTQWMVYSLQQYQVWSIWIEQQLTHHIWKWAFPYKIYQPLRFYSRLRQVLRWIRYGRFAFPLARMCLKLFDQLMALTKTWRQSKVASSEKAKRLEHRSLLLKDIRKVESLAKLQTALARLPSTIFRNIVKQTHGEDAAMAMAHNLHQQQEHGRKIHDQLQQLKIEVKQSFAHTADLYDQVVQLTQELKVALNKTLLSSHNLISPHSRFSVMWRVTVTNCLMMELFRLTVSWYLTSTFKLSTTQIISRLLIDCEVPEIKHHFAFFRDRVDDVRKHLSNVIPLLPPPDDFLICVPSGSSARLILQFGGMLEAFVDVVSFADIFIWFFTGDLDMEGVIIPKPFFTRCILPGTLVQVLDHPTLPEKLPTLIAQIVEATRVVGWSRAIRWALAIGPAFVMLVVNPFKSYFFRHMDIDTTQDLLIRCAESFGMLSPIRPSFGSAGNLRGSTVSTSSSEPPNEGILRASSSHPENLLLSEGDSPHPSQVGLSFDSPVHRGRTLVNMNQEESSFISTPSHGFIPPPLSLPESQLPTPPPPIPSPSPLIPRNKSIRFEIDDEEPDDEDGSYRLSYSGRYTSSRSLSNNYIGHQEDDPAITSAMFLKGFHPNKLD